MHRTGTDSVALGSGSCSYDAGTVSVGGGRGTPATHRSVALPSGVRVRQRVSARAQMAR
ncbi:hypothetical protein [Xanthomonas sp. 4461]|uniref:hypothetical protein n=1 Tax=Xanthomonas sp. 4461 TaxID=3035313 RepID=UPI00216A9B24|nr:hypothetical protein [Xanthomonas sp. 4461]MCS3808099.1 hypothetical protein [Xanthomonas sp. 4461]